MIPSRWRLLDRRLGAQLAGVVSAPPLRVGASLLAHSGDSVIWLLLGGLLWSCPVAASRALAFRIWLTVLVSSTLSLTLKHLFRRRRPAVPARGFYNAFDRYGFPSGHAVRVGALTVVLGAALPVGGTVALALWSLVVCASRIALRVHFVSDVAVGLLLGWIAGALLTWGCPA